LIGSAVCKIALEEGHTVVGLDRDACTIKHANFTSKVVDTTNYQQFLDAARGCNAIVHLAAMLPVSRGQVVPQEVIHYINVVSSYNALKIAADLGIKRVSQASSVNVIGLAFSRRPKLDYLPLDENHPFYPEDAYSLSKCICEQQADAFSRLHSWMRIASLRFHWVITSREEGAKQLTDAGTDSQLFADHSRDLWGWVSTEAAARACLLGLTAPESAFQGHEAFFIVAPTTVVPFDSAQLLKDTYPEVKDIRTAVKGNSGFFDCGKATKVLGWTENEA